MQLDVKEAEYEQVRTCSATCSAKRGVILRVHGAVAQKETPPRQQQEAVEMRTVVWLDALSVGMDDHGMVVRQYVHVCGAFVEMTRAVAAVVAVVVAVVVVDVAEVVVVVNVIVVVVTVVAVVVVAHVGFVSV